MLGGNHTRVPGGDEAPRAGQSGVLGGEGRGGHTHGVLGDGEEQVSLAVVLELRDGALVALQQDRLLRGQRGSAPSPARAPPASPPPHRHRHRHPARTHHGGGAPTPARRAEKEERQPLPGQSARRPEVEAALPWPRWVSFPLPVPSGTYDPGRVGGGGTLEPDVEDVTDLPLRGGGRGAVIKHWRGGIRMAGHGSPLTRRGRWSRCRGRARARPRGCSVGRDQPLPEDGHGGAGEGEAGDPAAAAARRNEIPAPQLQGRALALASA